MYKFNEKQKNDIISKYNSRICITHLSHEYNVDRSVIERFLIINGVKLRPRINLDEQEVCKLYLEGKTLSKLRIIFKSSLKTLKNILSKNNIKIKDSIDSRTKYKINDNFLNNPETWTEKQSYFMGWLSSDGTFTLNKGVRIYLQETDKRILEILKNIIDYGGNLLYERRDKVNDIITGNFKNRWGLAFSNRNIAKDLSKLGITNNKTHNLEFPNYLNKDLFCHYLRAYYEGDGCFCISKENKISISLIATEQFLLELQKFLKTTLGINSFMKKSKCIDSVKVLRFGGYLNALIFFNFIYNDAHFVLKRKFRKFLKLVNMMKRRKTWKKKEIPENVAKEIQRGILIAKHVISTAKY